MASDSGEIVGQVARLREDFKSLTELVTGPEALTMAASTMELRIFREVLTLGRRLLELFFTMRASKRPGTPRSADGTPLTECHLRRVTYLSVFGKIQFTRHRFHSAGKVGVSPLDEELSLPARCYSDLLRDWVEYEATDAAYGHSARTIQRILGIDIATNALEILLGEDAADVEAFYARKQAPAPSEEGPLLVAQADGAGIRLVDTEPSEQTGHRTSKREAIVTAHYSILRHVRTPQAMAEALMHTADTPVPPLRLARPAPRAKEMRGTLEGKDAALTRLAERVARRDGTHIQDRVALTDGSEALQDRMTQHLPDFTLVLDIMHVLDYLWSAARALYDGRQPGSCRGYVHIQLERLLHGQTQAVIDDLRQFADQVGLTATQRKPVEDAMRYFTNNADHMRYDRYLARGWPIATGVVEGGCKHLVRGRLDRSGMKWTRPAAHAMLQLRATSINGDWDDYQIFRRRQEHLRLYGLSPSPTCPEVQILDLAA